MMEVNPYDVIEYIKNSIEILLNMKDDDYDELKEEVCKLKQNQKGLIKKIRELEKTTKPSPAVREMYIQDIAEVKEGSLNMAKQDSQDPPDSSASSQQHTFAYDPPTEYEDIIRKLENDVRNHI